jgi:putative SOS response-associated peptidase YedK
MCGRFSQLPSQSPFQAPRPELADAFARIPTRYNLAPGQTASVLIKPNADIELATLQWGLLPFWAKELSLASHTFNARLDTVDDKPSFRAAFKTRHAVIPMAGYYEWQKTPGGKQPYYFHAEKVGEILWVAGLWEPRHALQTDASHGTFTIITQPAEGLPASIHNRMPVFMDTGDVEKWLSLKPGPSMPFLLTRSLPTLKTHAVSKRVNAAHDDDAELIVPVELA